MNFYEILGVARGATTEQIRHAHKLRVRETHPLGSLVAPAEFREVRVAYEVLSDPKKRRDYDAALAAVVVAVPPKKPKKKRRSREPAPK